MASASVPALASIDDGLSLSVVSSSLSLFSAACWNVAWSRWLGLVRVLCRHLQLQCECDGSVIPRRQPFIELLSTPGSSVLLPFPSCCWWGRACSSHLFWASYESVFTTCPFSKATLIGSLLGLMTSWVHVLLAMFIVSVMNTLLRSRPPIWWESGWLPQ